MLCGCLGRELCECFRIVERSGLLEATGTDADEAIGRGLFACELSLACGRKERALQWLGLHAKGELSFECAGGADAMNVIPTIGAGGTTATEAEVAHAHERRFERHARCT